MNRSGTNTIQAACTNSYVTGYPRSRNSHTQERPAASGCPVQQGATEPWDILDQLALQVRQGLPGSQERLARQAILGPRFQVLLDLLALDPQDRLERLGRLAHPAPQA